MKNFYKIVSEVFKIEPEVIKDEWGPEDISEWDSLGQLKIITAIETHYKIRFETTEVFEIFSIGDIKKLLAKRGIIIN